MISRGCFLMTSRMGAFSISVGFDQLAEYRRLQDAEPDPQADADQHDRNRKRHPPAPGQELIAGPGAEGEHREIGQEQSARDAELRPRCHQAALAVMARPLHRQQHRAAPLAADADALEHPQHRQHHGAPYADLLVGRHEGDEERRDAHAQQRRDQRPFAADPVAVMTEDGGADGSADKADKIGAECSERRRKGILVGEVELAEDQARGGPVQEEVVPLDRGADGRRDDGLAQLSVMGGRGFRPVNRCRGHSDAPLSPPSCVAFARFMPPA